MKMESMYEQLGVSAAVYEYGERIIAELRDRFDAIDQTAEYNHRPRSCPPCRKIG